jgi:deoxyribodipyrimidine photo-lyase
MQTMDAAQGIQVVWFKRDLQQNWREGADWFERHLIDYDPCSNRAYVARVGNDPRPDRRFNTQRQAEMYDPDGAYRALWQ